MIYIKRAKVSEGNKDAWEWVIGGQNRLTERDGSLTVDPVNCSVLLSKLVTMYVIVRVFLRLI